MERESETDRWMEVWVHPSAEALGGLVLDPLGSVCWGDGGLHGSDLFRHVPQTLGRMAIWSSRSVIET